MFSLVFQNDDFLVIDKHPGVSVHKDDNDQRCWLLWPSKRATTSSISFTV